MEIQKELLSTDSIYKCPHRLGFRLTGTSSEELSPDLPHVWQGTRLFEPNQLPSKVCIRSKLRQEPDSGTPKWNAVIVTATTNAHHDFMLL